MIETERGGPRRERPALSRDGLAGGRVRRVAPLLVSAACVGLLVWVLRDRLPAVWQAMGATDPSIVALALLAFPLAWYALALRIAVVFRAFGFGQSSFRFFLYTLVGNFFDLFLPTNIGGDVVKAGYAAGGTNRVAAAFLATFLDRALGLLGTVLVGSVGLFFFPAFEAGPAALVLGVGVVTALAALMLVGGADRWTEPLLSRLERAALAKRLRVAAVARAVLDLFRTPRIALLTLLLSLCAHALSTLSLWLSARALGIETAYPTLLLVVPVITLAALVPSIKLVGAREAALVVVLQAMMPEAQALALTIVSSGVRLAWSGVGGLVFLLRKPLGLSLPKRANSYQPIDDC